MRILVLSLNYRPDLSACSFRTTALVKALLDQLPESVHVEVITTLPHRYDSFTVHALALEELPRLTIRRIKLPTHGSGMVAQARAFVIYAREALTLVEEGEYDLVYGTSSRLMTAALSAHVARKKRLPLYLDIRDIFVDTIKDVLPAPLGWLGTPFFSIIERWTIARADNVNLVSRGFESYFSHRYPRQHYSYFTNGIDDEFIRAGCERLGVPLGDGRPLLVLYAGNIGEGQGLDAIVPKLATRLEGRAVFRVIGDGGRKRQLQEELDRAGCTNVQVLAPMKREQLLEAYREADVLFLHLNNHAALKKVLPSKLFEYAAMGKPIWAGLSGYAASFVKEEIENAAVFPPCNPDGAMSAFSGLKLEEVVRTVFVNQYARTRIMQEMASDIAQLLPITGLEDAPHA